MKKLKIIQFVFFVLIAFLATGCSQQSQSPQTQAQVPTKKLIVATDSGYYPFEMIDKNGNLIGYDIDLAKALGEYLNMEVEIQGFNGIAGVISALQAQKADLGMAAITITEKRKESLDFSEPYFQSYQNIVVNNKHKDVKGWEELDKPGIVIAVNRGSAGEQTAQEFFKKATIKQYDSSAEVGQVVLNSQVDALVTLDTWCKIYKMYNPDKVYILPQQLGQPQLLGIAVSKGNKELIDKVNAFLKQYKENGEQAKNYQKWFENSDWKELVPPKK